MSIGDIRAVEILNPLDFRQRRVHEIPYDPAITFGDLVGQVGLNPDETLVLRGTTIEENLDTKPCPGEWVYLHPIIKEPVSWFIAITLGTLASSIGVGTATMGTIIGIFSSAIVATGVAVAGGYVLRALMPGPAVPGAQPVESPTYGWTPQANPTEEGASIPVVYGNIAVVPTLIGYYIEIDDAGDQWGHFLLCCHEGETNNVPISADILANNEPLGGYQDYTVKATDGSLSPDTDQLDKFRKLHQPRGFNKYIEPLTHDAYVRTLLHLNGPAGSTIITDDSNYEFEWSCISGAVLTQTSPKFGSACLDATGAGDYIESTDSYSLIGITIYPLDLFFLKDDEWDFELWFKTPDNTQDSGIIGQKSSYSGYDMFWSLAFVSGNLEFQLWKDPGAGAITTYWNVSAAWAPANDTWYHLRVAHDTISGTRTIKIWIDGSVHTSGTESTTQVDMFGASSVNAWVGSAYQDVAGTPTAYDGNCYIDEVRVCWPQLLYNWDNTFTIPTSEVTLVEGEIEYRTNGVVDEVTFIFEAPLGIYHQDDDASLDSIDVDFMIEYKTVDESTWTEYGSYTFSGGSRYPVRDQLNITLPSRAKYDLRLYRTTPLRESTKDQDRVYWIALDEILDEFLSYPGLQVIQVSLRAQDRISGNVPLFKVICDRDRISVPEFDGSGTQTVDADNNAWAAFDMFTNDIYSAGVSPTRFDQTAWEEWRDWCAGLVDGNKRCQFNMTFDREYDLDRAVQHVENCGRARLVMRGTEISVAIEKPTSETYAYSAGNIIKGTFEQVVLPKRERIDSVVVEFMDKDKNWSMNTSPPAEASDYASLTRPPKLHRLRLLGVNNLEQATREAIQVMQLTDAIKRVCTFRAGFHAIRSTVGDVFAYQHDGNVYSFGGRLSQDVDAHKSIKIDKTITLDSTEFENDCKMYIITSGDTLYELTVTGPFDEETNIVEVDAEVTASRYDTYMICKASAPMLYRAVRVTRTPKKRFELKGVQYDEDAYYHKNYDAGGTAI